MASLQDDVDHITEAYCSLQLAVRDANLHLLEAWNAAKVQELKGYFMTEVDVSSLSLMTITEWEKLAFDQDVKVNNNPSVTKNVMGES